MVPARSSRHGISCSWHLSRSQAEIPLIPAVQISRASSVVVVRRFEVQSASALIKSVPKQDRIILLGGSRGQDRRDHEVRDRDRAEGFSFPDRRGAPPCSLGNGG
ncbi:hypothetical protein ELG66_12120 [Rhizobium leguminosarum]|nr:hypothetical protein ELG66_12120 [Rhizobium leguminosarum]